MENQKQAKHTKKGKFPRGIAISVIAVAAVLFLGFGFTHISLAPRYKDYTNPEPGWCAVCHKTPASHADQWTINHGVAALYDRANCITCHKSDYCTDCHKKKPASHDSNWAVAHMTGARKDGRGCYECHASNYCTDCHDKVRR